MRKRKSMWVCPNCCKRYPLKDIRNTGYTRCPSCNYKIDRSKLVKKKTYRTLPFTEYPEYKKYEQLKESFKK